MKITDLVFEQNYQYIEHTADVGVKVYAATKEGVYETFGLLLFEILFDFSEQAVRPSEGDFTVRVTADDDELLLIELLSQLLFLFFEKHFVAVEIIVTRGEHLLAANLRGQVLPKERFRVKHEIKAVTYHQLYIKQVDLQKYEAQVIFDV